MYCADPFAIVQNVLGGAAAQTSQCSALYRKTSDLYVIAPLYSLTGAHAASSAGLHSRYLRICARMMQILSLIPLGCQSRFTVQVYEPAA